MKRLLIFYGLMAGVLLTGYVTMLDYTRIIYETSWGQYAGYLAILILPICIYLALHELSKQQRQLLYRQSVLFSLVVSLLAATCYSAYTFIDIHFFDASHLKNLFTYTGEQMEAEGKTLAEIQERINRMQQHYHSSKPYISTYVWYVCMGLVYSVLFFFVFRVRYRKPIA
jgi:hypothetical protein